MPRVLVTGLGGFIGRRTVPFFRQAGYEVVGVGRRPRPDGMDAGVEWIEADLGSYEAIRACVARVRPSHCLHLAWDIEQGSYWRAPVNLLWVRLSLELVAAFAEAGGQRFVGAGSCAEYDWSEGCLSEDGTPRTAATPFGRCKTAVYEALMASADTLGFSAAWARIFFVYGPGEPAARLFPSVILNLLANRPARTSSGTQRRDFMHVDDVAAALVALVDSTVTGGVNIGTGEAPAVRAIVEKIGAALGRADLLEIGALPQRAGDPPLLVADVRRLRDEVGFRPRHTLDSGLAATIEACRGADRRS